LAPLAEDPRRLIRDAILEVANPFRCQLAWVGPVPFQGRARGRLEERRRVTISKLTKAMRTDARTTEEPMVPKPRPPRSDPLVRKSPIVAPNGRVSTKAIQNNRTREIDVKYVTTSTTPSTPRET